MSPLSCGCHHRGQFANRCRSHGANSFCSFLFLRLWTIFSTPDVWLRIAVAQCASMFVGSHEPHKGYGQRFHRDQICHLRLTCEKFHVCAVCIWLISKRDCLCGSRCCIVRVSIARKPFSGDVDRARLWRIVSSPCQHLQILRKTTLHDVPAVEADILTLHKLLHKVSEKFF